VASPDKDKKKRVSTEVVWREARELVWAHRSKLVVGMLLMVVNRLAGLVLPTSSKFLIDRVLPQHRVDLLGELALAVGLATLVQAGLARRAVAGDARAARPSPTCGRRSRSTSCDCQ
jgi:subfamily B ATP-binding cassette protein MsbA